MIATAKPLTVLGIETSCDETAVAIVDSNKTIRANLIYSQIKEHQEYGGVVPEIAARNHMLLLPNMVDQALKTSGLNLAEIDAIAVTAGPGLIGGVIVGAMLAKGMALAMNKPCLPINHLEGHALSVRLASTDQTKTNFPYLLLLISGGHCQFIYVAALGEYRILGGTVDDAAGEAFDKVAKMLNLGSPGGPIVEKRAATGNPNIYNFPKAFFGQKHCNMSFSGLKTAVLREIEKHNPEPKHKAESNLERLERTSNQLATTLDDITINNICASFQRAVAGALKDRLQQAIDIIISEHGNINCATLVVAGGVAANQYIRTELENITKTYNWHFVAPPLSLCTDNAAMIAWAGIEQLKNDLANNINLKQKYDLKFIPKSRWQL